MVMIIYS